MYKLTGHPTVDAIGQLNFEGNITPHTWYSHVRYVNKRGIYTDHLAIAILAEIVYWHRPTAVYDETTGKQTGWRKKFKADKLKKSYAALSEKLGATDKQVRESTKLLVQLDLVDLEFKTDIEKGINVGNVMFIGLNPERLKEITFTVMPLTNFTPIPEMGDSPPLSPKSGIASPRNGEYPIPELGKSTIYTENTTKNTNKEEDSPTPHAFASVVESASEQNPVAPEPMPIITQDLTTAIVESALEQIVLPNENNNQTQPTFLSDQEREMLKQAQNYAFNPAIAPWRDGATIVNSKVQRAIFEANPGWYSTGNGSVNIKKINDRIKSLERKMMSTGAQAIEAYVELMTYVTMSQVPNSAEIIKQTSGDIKQQAIANNLMSMLSDHYSQKGEQL